MPMRCATTLSAMPCRERAITLTPTCHYYFDDRYAAVVTIILSADSLISSFTPFIALRHWFHVEYATFIEYLPPYVTITSYATTPWPLIYHFSPLFMSLTPPLVIFKIRLCFIPYYAAGHLYDIRHACHAAVIHACHTPPDIYAGAAAICHTISLVANIAIVSHLRLRRHA